MNVCIAWPNNTDAWYTDLVADLVGDGHTVTQVNPTSVAAVTSAYDSAGCDVLLISMYSSGLDYRSAVNAGRPCVCCDPSTTESSQWASGPTYDAGSADVDFLDSGHYIAGPLNDTDDVALLSSAHWQAEWSGIGSLTPIATNSAFGGSGPCIGAWEVGGTYGAGTGTVGARTVLWVVATTTASSGGSATLNSTGRACLIRALEWAAGVDGGVTATGSNANVSVAAGSATPAVSVAATGAGIGVAMAAGTVVPGMSAAVSGSGASLAAATGQVAVALAVAATGSEAGILAEAGQVSPWLTVGASGSLATLALAAGQVGTTGGDQTVQATGSDISLGMAAGQAGVAVDRGATGSGAALAMAAGQALAELSVGASGAGIGISVADGQASPWLSVGAVGSQVTITLAAGTVTTSGGTTTLAPVAISWANTVTGAPVATGWANTITGAPIALSWSDNE